VSVVRSCACYSTAQQTGAAAYADTAGDSTGGCVIDKSKSTMHVGGGWPRPQGAAETAQGEYAFWREEQLSAVK